ncbi:hypothetical protein LTR84_008205 [Exophiala bonariae]|uniref:PGG domain-containing protein n=1 Tax=Exophiala bonariae TaxID=1690606 RepID=A0AAV9MXW0_9EURO|nr:hypothetical protein LTR84_008205 [Exophiala bonariae]
MTAVVVTQQLEQKTMAFRTHYSSIFSLEMTETIPGTGNQDQSSAPSSAKFQQVLAKVGPWPLKRSPSSQTTIVSIEASSKVGSLEGNPKLSEVLTAVDKHCEQIEDECKRTEFVLETMAVLEATSPLRNSSSDEIKVVASSSSQNTKDQVQGDATALLGRDMERQSTKAAHPLGPCCPQCEEALERARESATAALFFVAMALVVILTSPPLIATVFAKSEQLAMFNVQGGADKTKQQCLKLMSIPVVAMAVIYEIVVWSLATQVIILPPGQSATGLETAILLVVLCVFTIIAFLGSLSVTVAVRLYPII